ncbi:hypothetical protein ACWKWU_04350 [Chitinophaga lutea]
MNKLFLALIALFNPLWRKLGADPAQLAAILQVKLTMDDRRPNAYTQMRQQKSESNRRGSWALVLISGLMGVFYLIVFSLSPDPLMQLFLWFSIFMVMLSVTLISDFTSVLIDVKDNFVILPRPVGDRTIVMARILHIMAHVSKIVVPLSLPAAVYIAFTQGWAVLVFLPLVLFASVLCIFIINAVYLVALQVTSPQRFREILNYIQIIFSILIFAIYYLGPRLARGIDLQGFDLWGYPVAMLAPSFWFAAAYETLAGIAVSGRGVAMTVLAMAMPAASLWAVVRIFAPSFSRKLAMIGGGSESPREAAVARKQAASGRMPLYKRLSRLVAKGPEEQVGFDFVWLMTARVREFKLKVYPSIAYVVVYFVYSVFFRRGTDDIAERWAELPQSQMFYLLIYSSPFVFITAIGHLVYSDKYKAGWVYFAAPVETPGTLLMGAFKAAYAKFFIPVYIAISAFTLSIWGLPALPDLLLGFVNVTLVNILFAFMHLRKLPFATETNVKQSAGKFLKGLLILVIPGGLGLLHYLVSLLRGGKPVFGISLNVNWLLGLFGLLAAAAIYTLYGQYRETSWQRVMKD